MADKTLVLIDRVQAIQDQLDSGTDQGPSGSGAFLAKIAVISALPDSANAYYAVHPVRVSGDVGEGLVPTLTASSRVVYAANLGTQVPPDPGTADTYVVVIKTAGRNVFVYNG